VKLPPFPVKMTPLIEEAVERVGPGTASELSKALSKTLKEIGFDHETEVGKIMSIDFACKKKKIAIELDGPTHYLKAARTGELTMTENGPTKAKRRFLEQLGWKVINIDYREYYLVKGASNEKRWLRKKLTDAGVVL